MVKQKRSSENSYSSINIYAIDLYFAEVMKNIKQLHDRDFNLWIEETIRTIRNKDVNNMDWENLLEEIEDMGASQKRALDSYVQRLIEHILKLKYWHSERERNERGWRTEVVNFRNRINRILKKNPSLKNYLESEYPDNYNDAIAAMSESFEVPNESYIQVKEIMKQDYFG